VSVVEFLSTEGSSLDLEKIVTELEEERDRLNQAIDLLKERNQSTTARKTMAGNGRVSTGRRSGGLTPAGRKKLSKLMKKRWAERRKEGKSS
jgi:hypothetical protein